jgi:hypothetical protein
VITVITANIRSQWPLACWDCGFELSWGHGSLSLVIVVCCQVEVSATGRSFVQGSPTESGVPECDLETSTMRRPRPIRAVEPLKKGVGTRWQALDIHCELLADGTRCFQLVDYPAVFTLSYSA